MAVERRPSPIVVGFQVNLTDFWVNPIVGDLVELRAARIEYQFLDRGIVMLFL